MPSLITGIIGGIQGASAQHNAANALSGAYGQAGNTVTGIANTQDPLITGTANQAGQGVVNAAGTAGQNVVSSAGTAIAGLNPYTQAGSGAAQSLGTALAPGGSLSKPFDASMMESQDPGYEFRIQQAQQGLQREQAAQGITGGGGASMALDKYTQNLASGEYQNAFNNYQTNNNNIFNRLSTVAGMGQQASEFAGNLGVGAQQYAGNLNTGAAQYAGTANINAQDLSSSNALSAGNYLANTQIGQGKAIAGGDIGAANAWNGMLGAIGSAGNTVMGLGFGGFLPGQQGVGWGQGGGTGGGNMFG